MSKLSQCDRCQRVFDAQGRFVSGEHEVSTVGMLCPECKPHGLIGQKFSHEYNAAVHKNETLKKRGVVDFSTPEMCAETYGAGFVGSICDPEGMDRLVDDGLCPTFEDVAGHLQRDYGGTNALLYQYVLKLDPNAYEEKQTTGDCFVAGTLVRMADGSEKPIEEVAVGEFVVSADNREQRVTRTIRKPYSGAILDIRCSGYSQGISCTPDHRFVTLPDLWQRDIKNSEARWRKRSERREWKAAVELEARQFLLMPHCTTQEVSHTYDLHQIVPECELSVSRDRIRQKHSKRSSRRIVHLDSRLGWLLGLFAAEGSICYQKGKPLRVTLNLDKNETLLAEGAAQAFRDIFDAPARVYQVPSKPSVLYVRCQSSVVASCIHQLIPGNVWSKEVPRDILTSPRSVRLAFLRGWMDGDGCLQTERKNYGACKLTGVSASTALARGMWRVANSCGLKASLTKRKARKQSKEAYDVHLYGEQAVAVYPERRTEIEARVKLCTRHHELVADGTAVEVASVNVRHVENSEVFCLEVEHDHSFVANGFAVHNCVSHGTRNAVDCARAVEILLKGEPEEWVARGATEAIYGCRGHGGQGMSCDQATRFVASAGGILLRLNYPDLSLDLSKYNASIGTGWGRSGVPANVVAEAKKHQAVYSARITSVEGAIAALSNGYGVHCCSGMGFSGSRDDSGFSDPRGSWAHDMACVGHATEGLREEGFLIQNSWGAWNSGPTKLGQAPGSFWVTKSVMARLIAANGTFAVGNVRGWPARSLPDLGSNWQQWMTPA